MFLRKLFCFPLILCMFLCCIQDLLSGERENYQYTIKGFSLTAVKIITKQTNKLATGFLMRSIIETSKSILITNKHVFKSDSSIVMVMQTSDSSRWNVDTVIASANLYSSKGDSLFAVSRTGADVAGIVIELPQGKPDMSTIWHITSSAFAFYRDLYAGEKVIYFGFPLGLTVNAFEPLLRIGTIAGIDSLKNIIYLDAQSFGGSSGSPVFVDQLDLLDKSPIFVGIIEGYVNYKKFLQNKETQETEMIQTENSGIAKVVPAAEILKVGNDALSIYKSKVK